MFYTHRIFGDYRSTMDDIDREIVRILQTDVTLSVREIAEIVGLTSTPCWRRLQNLEANNVIKARVALINPEAVNLSLTALVLIKTNEHNAKWTQNFHDTIGHFDEVVEVYRTSGELDYLLKVVVPDMVAYDQFYLRLIEQVDLYDVRSTFVMEQMKHTTALPLHYA